MRPKTRILSLSILVFVMACTGEKDEKDPKAQSTIPQETESSSGLEIPLSGFELQSINLDSMADDLKIDSAGYFKDTYREMLDDFLSQPIEKDSLFASARINDELKPKAILYASVASLNEFKAYEIYKHNSRFVAGFPLTISDTLIYQDTTERSNTMIDTSLPIDTVFMASIDTHIVELALFSPDTSDFSFKPLILKKGVKVGMHYNELIKKLGIGFIKNGDRLFYHNWNDRVGIFEIDDKGLVKTIIIGHYAIDLSNERELPSFYLNYVSF